VSTAGFPPSRPARLLGVLGAVVLLAAALAPAAAAVPPPNDTRFAPQFFQPYSAENGNPQDLQAIAELAEATADGPVPRCLGPSSFVRTVWYRVPGATVPQELTVEAAGRTLAVVDLAAFVQPAGATEPVTAEPNACSGLGAGGSDASEEPTSGVTLRVPAGRDVLFQVGHRGRPGPVENERVVVSLDAQPLDPFSIPAGDFADPATTPRASTRRGTIVPLFGTTTTEEDPAQPPCPSLGSIWRRVEIGRRKPARRLVRVTGASVSTLAVFSGSRPTGENVLDCVTRSDFGPLHMLVPTRRGRDLWIRLGSDRPSSGRRAKIRVEDGTDRVAVDGGPGGFDPTTGGPGGGLPAACERSDTDRALIRGRRITGSAERLNRRPTIAVRVRVRRGPVCDVEVELVNRRGHVYGTTRAVWLKGRRVVRLRRVGQLRRGVYRLRVTAISQLGERERVRTRVSGRLAK
jgi:hypothetical protein